jgi:hypothetical protein
MRAIESLMLATGMAAKFLTSCALTLRTRSRMRNPADMVFSLQE